MYCYLVGFDPLLVVPLLRLPEVPLLLLLPRLLVPVFVLMNNVIFSRQLSLYNAELITEGKDALFTKLDSFFFDGKMGENIGDALGGLKISHSPMIWIWFATLFVSLLAAISLRYGEIKSGLLRGILYVFAHFPVKEKAVQLAEERVLPFCDQLRIIQRELP